MVAGGFEGHAAAVVAAALVGLPAAGGLAEIRCSLTDQRIAEASGIASSTRSDDVVYIHNDSGDEARFFAVDARTCATRATYQLAGATNVDWEDMTSAAAADGAPVLWLADIGDNASKRSSVVVYEVDEPEGNAPGGSVRLRSRWTLTYPDGPHDAETLLVDPETGRPVIVTKDLKAGRSQAYRLPAAGSGTLERLAGLDVRALPGGALAAPAWALTGGATSPDRRSVVLRSYLVAWRWATAPGEPLATTLARPPERVTVPLGRQAEAVAFSRDGTGLWTTSEGIGAPLALVPLVQTPSAPLPEVPRAVTPEPGRPLTPKTRSMLGLTLVIGGATSILGLLAIVLARRRR